jgi:hypothetical protein
LFDLNESRNTVGTITFYNNTNSTFIPTTIAELESNEYHKLKSAYDDLLDLKNTLEAKG